MQLEGPVREDIEPDHVHLEDRHDGRAEGGLVAGVGPASDQALLLGVEQDEPDGPARQAGTGCADQHWLAS